MQASALADAVGDDDVAGVVDGHAVDVLHPLGGAVSRPRRLAERPGQPGFAIRDVVNAHLRRGGIGHVQEVAAQRQSAHLLEIGNRRAQSFPVCIEDADFRVLVPDPNLPVRRHGQPARQRHGDLLPLFAARLVVKQHPTLEGIGDVNHIPVHGQRDQRHAHKALVLRCRTCRKVGAAVVHLDAASLLGEGLHLVIELRWMRLAIAKLDPPNGKLRFGSIGMVGVSADVGIGSVRLDGNALEKCLVDNVVRVKLRLPVLRRPLDDAEVGLIPVVDGVDPAVGIHGDPFEEDRDVPGGSGRLSRVADRADIPVRGAVDHHLPSVGAGRDRPVVLIEPVPDSFYNRPGLHLLHRPQHAHQPPLRVEDARAGQAGPGDSAGEAIRRRGLRSVVVAKAPPAIKPREKARPAQDASRARENEFAVIGCLHERVFWLGVGKGIRVVGSHAS